MIEKQTYGFSDDFQDMILACFIRKPNDFTAFGEIVQPKFFNGSVAYDVCFEIREFAKKHKRYPSFVTLGNSIYKRFISRNPDRAKECVDYVKKLAQVNTEESDAVRDMVCSFAKERAVQNAFRVALDTRAKGEEIPGGLVKLFEDALAVGSNLDDLGIWLHCDIDLVRQKLDNKDYGIKTGFEPLDNVWKRGFAPGWLIVPLAPPKRFKSTFCLNLALNMCGHGMHKNVFYYACEISQELAFLRGLHKITQLTEEQFWAGQEMFWMEAKQLVEAHGKGKLMFKGYPAKKATIAEIKLHAKNVIQTTGVQPSAIIIDYAETVRAASEKGTSDWRSQAEIYTDARAMGAELGCAIIMPDRCNADTVDKKVPSMKSFQGSFEKAGIVDAAIGLCATEEEYMMGVIRYFIFVNRHGPQYLHFRGKVDPARYTMTVDEEIEYDPEAEDKEEAASARKRGGGFRVKTRQVSARQAKKGVDALAEDD